MTFEARRRDRPSEVGDAPTYRYIRYGIQRDPTWVNGSDQTAPSTTTDLVSRTVTAGKTGRIFGWQIVAPEANEFIINIGGVARRIAAFGGAGVVIAIFDKAIFDGIAAATVINVRVATAGSAGKVYRVDLLYDEG